MNDEPTSALECTDASPLIGLKVPGFTRRWQLAASFLNGSWQ